MAKINNDEISLSDEQKSELIQLVCGYPKLWNLQGTSYCMTKLKDKNVKWQLIASHLNTSMKIVKAIWKNLRTVFGREVPKCICSKSGDSDDEENEIYTGEWPFFDELRFLSDTMTGRALSGPLKSATESTASSAKAAVPAMKSSTQLSSLADENVEGIISNQTIEVILDDGNDTQYLEEVFVPEEEEDLSMFKLQTKRTSSSDSGMGTQPPKKKTAIQRALDIEEKKIQVYQEEKKKKFEDEDTLFLKLLHPYMQKANDKLSLRYEVIATVKTFLRNEELGLSIS